MATRPLRILAAVGPGDVVAAHADQRRGVRTLSETSVTFSSQTFDAFRSLDATFWAISSYPRADTKMVEGGRVENRPRGGGRAMRGWRWHGAQVAYAASLVRSALAFRATHAIVDSGTAHWFLFAPLRALGIQVVPNLHNVQWNEGFEGRGPKARGLKTLDGLFFRWCVRDALGVSPECGRQVAILSSGRSRFHDYRAQFSAEDFASIDPPPVSASPFHVLFVGRIERNKGVFDLLETSELLNKAGHDDVVIDVCGGGGASAELAEQVRARGLEGRVALHGKLERPALLDVYGRSSVVIVPTRSDFCEGLPMVCAEAVLAGRPVVTSRISNALEALGAAVSEAAVDEPADYARRLAELREDADRRRRCTEAAPWVARQFIDPSRGLCAAIQRALRPAKP